MRQALLALLSLLRSSCHSIEHRQEVSLLPCCPCFASARDTSLLSFERRQEVSPCAKRRQEVSPALLKRAKVLKVLVLGQGAREHALGWKLSQSGHAHELFFAPGNSGTASLGRNVPLDLQQVKSVADWAFLNRVDLTVVGPENPLMNGIGEEFALQNLLLFGPESQGAKLEGSKSFAKDFLRRHGIPTARSELFSRVEEAKAYVLRHPLPLVIKADGLAQGKGVAVCATREEAYKTLDDFMTRHLLGEAGKVVLVEEFLRGEELSAFALLDGKTFCYLGEARDYKRAHDRDEGPNTGGMGSVSFSGLIPGTLKEKIGLEIFQKVLEGLNREGIAYRGVLYAGLMLCRDGPKVLEFNVRFGDPEAQVLLPRLEEDLLLLFLATAKGELSKLSRKEAKLSSDAAVGVVVAASGYPGTFAQGNPLPDLRNIPQDLLVFSASTALREGRHVNLGGRTVTLVGRGPTIPEARKRVYEHLSSLAWEGFFYRKDIGLELVPTGTLPEVSP